MRQEMIQTLTSMLPTVHTDLYTNLEFHPEFRQPGAYSDIRIGEGKSGIFFLGRETNPSREKCLKVFKLTLNFQYTKILARLFSSLFSETLV